MKRMKHEKASSSCKLVQAQTVQKIPQQRELIQLI